MHPWLLRLLQVLVLAGLSGGLLVACVAGPATPVPMGTETGTAPLTPSASTTVAAADRRDLATASDESDTAKRARIRTELAAAYFGQGQYTTALDEAKRALAVDPNHVPALNLRGLIYAAMGELDLAEESFRTALRVGPGDADTLHNYGWYLCQRGRWPEARQQFATAMNVPQYREQARTLLAAGICEARAGDLATAQTILQRSFDLDPASPATTYNLADVLMRRGELERAYYHVQRINQTPELVRAESLWLAIRIQHRRQQAAAVEELGAQLRARFPQSREAAAFERGQFDE
jgi:type IV pilus assembly protein PilF